ncbi:O-antigen ligase family protein [Alphaproteobacteria bacterium]|nr:O-antigen ligase family protein [Alphaproteobacteria bacterium]
MLNIAFIPFKSLFFDRAVSLDVLIFSLLLIFIPVALITGPAIPDIFLSLIALYFLFISILKKKWSYYLNPIVYGFFLFSLYGVLRSIFSETPLLSLNTGGSFFYFRYIFFAMGVWYLLDKNPYLSKCLMIISFLSILVVSIDGTYQYFFGVNIFGNEKHSIDRLTGLFGDEPIIGRYIAYLSIFTFSLIYQNYGKTKITILVSVIFLIICEVVVFLSGERAPFFYLILFTILLIILIPQIRLYRLISLSLSIIIILIITSFIPYAKDRIIDVTTSQIKQTSLPFLPYSDHHEEHYVSALKMFIDKPIFGIGTNLFRFQCNKSEYKYKTRSCNTHPHNFYLQILAEQGFVGLFFLIIFYLFLSKLLIKNFIFTTKSNNRKKISTDFILFLIVLFIYWWPLIPHMGFYNNWNNVLMMLPLGFFMRYIYGNLNNGFTYKV